MFSPVKILISIVYNRDWKPYFGVSLINAVVHTSKHGLGNGISADLLMAPAILSSNLSANRQKVLDAALATSCDYIFMVDDDMAFPQDAIVTLFNHKKDLVCANVCQRDPDKVNGVCLSREDGGRINSKGRTGIERIKCGTLALTLINLEKVRTIPHPHFEVVWDYIKGFYIAEDHSFFERMNSAGIEFWCDHDLSNNGVMHIGDYPYRFQ